MRVITHQSLNAQEKDVIWLETNAVNNNVERECRRLCVDTSHVPSVMYIEFYDRKVYKCSASPCMCVFVEIVLLGFMSMRRLLLSFICRGTVILLISNYQTKY